jgi:uncharacterized membrane protein YdjX (TVP38/TMEM64 family)
MISLEILTYTIAVAITIMLFLTALYYIVRYFKTKEKVFTVKKIVFLAIMFSIYIFQVYLPIPLIGNTYMTGITTLIVGFIMGPLIGMLFGVLTDSFSMLING